MWTDVTDLLPKPSYLGRTIDAMELATCHRCTLPGGRKVTSRLDGVDHAAAIVDVDGGGETFAALYVHYQAGGAQWIADLFGAGLTGTRQDPALETAAACARGLGVPVFDYRIG